jgi:hypothetical protein
LTAAKACELLDDSKPKPTLFTVDDQKSKWEALLKELTFILNNLQTWNANKYVLSCLSI